MRYISKTALLSALFSSVILATGFTTGVKAESSDAASFLKGLDGSYRGKGKALYSDGKKTMNVSCQIANELSSDGNNLKISGVCATTQGKAAVNGELNLAGAKISGAFFSPNVNMQLTKSFGEVKDDALIMTSYFVNKTSGALTRIRQVVQKSDTGFSSSILTFDNAARAFKESGTINFKKKK